MLVACSFSITDWFPHIIYDAMSLTPGKVWSTAPVATSTTCVYTVERSVPDMYDIDRE